MSESEEPQGPIMLCATRVLKPPPARIGRLFGNVTLPRTVQVRVLVAAVIGAFAAFALTSAILGVTLRQTILSFGLGGGLGAGSMIYSPLQNESLFRWIGLQAQSRVGRIRYQGEWVRAYVGVCPVNRVAAGHVRIFPGAVDVPEGSVDERGWRRPGAAPVVTAAPQPIRRPAAQVRTAPLPPVAPTDLPELSQTPTWVTRPRPTKDQPQR